ncbi:MAG: SixA phosphatase family protein [Dehalococcoidia bacterium]
MKLYLVRHAVAYEHGDPNFPNDDDRTLTPEGRKRFRKAAAGLMELVDPPAVILTSPLPRASQTAAILQEAYGAVSRTALCDAMRPGGSFDDVLADCAAQVGEGATAGGGNAVLDRGIALVGHAPSIGLFAAWLLNGDSASFALELEKGGVACVDFDGLPEAGFGSLEWLATPRILRKLA